MDKRYPRTILATACVPWTDAFELDEARFVAGVQKLLDQDIRHIYLFGTAGEGYAINDALFQRLVTLFAKAMDQPGCQPMVGLISLSLKTMHDRIRFAYDQGIRDFMFALPGWGALADEEVRLFFHDLCDPYPDCRFFHYNNNRSKRLLTVADYEQLANDVPNFVGAKYSTSDLSILQALATSRSPLRFFITENGFAFASQLGPVGLLMSVGTCNIPQTLRFYDACLAQDTTQVWDMLQELKEVVEVLIDLVGPGKIDGSYDKVFSKIQDPAFPLRLLPPYIGTTDAAYEAFCSYLKKEQPQWIDTRSHQAAQSPL